MAAWSQDCLSFQCQNAANRSITHKVGVITRSCPGLYLISGYPRVGLCDSQTPMVMVEIRQSTLYSGERNAACPVPIGNRWVQAQQQGCLASQQLRNPGPLICIRSPNEYSLRPHPQGCGYPGNLKRSTNEYGEFNICCFRTNFQQASLAVFLLCADVVVV